MKLIDKDALVTEIERLKTIYKDDENIRHVAKYNILVDILSFLDTLEVKEVDLEKEIRRYRMRNPIIQHREESLYDYMANVAKKFFELGLKTQKGE